MFKRCLATICLLVTFNWPVQASETLVLIHGYLGTGATWRPTGIVAALQQAGWQDAGHLFPAAPLPNPLAADAERPVYTVTLPSEAPLFVQARWLNFYLHTLQQRHPEHQFILVGHSVGGVVARLSLVHNQFPVKTLITLASPHLGTELAELGLAAGQSPLGWITPLLGLSTINRSQGLYWELVREHPATPLFALNRQPHPDIQYVSIVRVGDSIVPPYSQDMNNIPALRGRALPVIVHSQHHLHPADGGLLASLLATIKN